MVTLEEFAVVRHKLQEALVAQLEEEILMNDFEVPEEEEHLWKTSVVDSKAVVKLSPIVESMTGRKIHPKWIKKGGYASVDEAITDIMKRIEIEIAEGKSSENG